MNWYKKAQIKQPLSLKSIEWAIDDLWLNEWSDQLDVEWMFFGDILQGQNYDQGVAKAAQVSAYPAPRINRNVQRSSRGSLIDPQYPGIVTIQGFKFTRDVFNKIVNLLNQGYKLSQISRDFDIPYTALTIYSKKYIGSKKDLLRQTGRDISQYDKEIRDTVEEMGSDFKKYPKSSDTGLGQIAKKLGVNERDLAIYCRNNNISIEEMTQKRKLFVENRIKEFVDNYQNVGLLDEAEVYRLFKQKTGHQISATVFRLVLYYKNLRYKWNKKENNIFAAFRYFILGKINSQYPLERYINEGKIPEKIDEFVNDYGKDWGFPNPPDKETLKKLLLLKVDFEERIFDIGDIPKENRRFVNQNKYQEAINMINEGQPIEYVSQYTEIPLKELEKTLQMYNIKTSPTLWQSYQKEHLGLDESYD